MSKTTVNYTISKVKKSILFGLVCMMAACAGIGIGLAARQDWPATCWVLCKPGAQVNIRQTPENNGRVVGFLEVGDSFRTDGKSANGWIHVLGIGEHGDAWIYCGFVVESEPVQVFENYVCVAKNRVACRRWVGGPQVANSPWLVNGSAVSVFWMTDEWAVTSRGYIKSEYLEADPL